MTAQPVPKSKLKVAILGATGTVGQRFITLLANHPFYQIHALCASPRSVGKQYAHAVQWKLSEDIPENIRVLIVDPCYAHKESRLSECQVAFSGLDSQVATEIEVLIARAGIPVFSNAKNFRMHPSVPLIVPTANADHLVGMVCNQVSQSIQHIMQKEINALVNEKLTGQSHILDTCLNRPNGYIVTNSNCSTTGLVIVLRALMNKFGPLNKVMVTSMQAVSGAGYPGLPVLDVFDNVVPYISGEEDKLETEPHKILGTINSTNGSVTLLDSMMVSASCNRVPVLDGHMLTVSVQFMNRDQVPLPEIVSSALKEYVPPSWDVLSQCPTCPTRPIHVSELPDRPQPRLDRDRGNGMTVTVGRVRQCPVLDTKLVVLSHNTVLGAAGSSLLNSELAYLQGLQK